ncbi:S24 family peptidase [Flavobacterium psychrophilum]|uniref:Peptidase S24 n=1 Tax=Flavobacterium psychrophilum TaxID=96345 RepID=A0A7U2NEI4_FLAPS|nr:hypothetical protein [Flavobacterium psychrophilum]QRE03548.1 peptidase S24 [Flavobacterium psychrophilum]
MIERILQVIDCYGINKNKFYKKTGLSNGFLDKVKNIGSDKIDKILNSFPEVDPEWLISGHGSMIKKPASLSLVESHLKSNQGFKIEAKQVSFDNFIEVPFLPIKAQAGYLTGFEENHPVDDLETKLFPREFEKGSYLTIEISGNSMNDNSSKSILDGDILLCKELDKGSWFSSKLHFRNNIFVIVDSSGIVCKQIVSHNVENSIITCRSWNEDFEDYNISLQEVYQIFYIKKIVDRKIKF